MKSTEKASKETQSEEKTEKKYSAEEIKEMRKATVNSYKSENQMLRLQHENLKYLAEIEEYKVRRLEALYKSAAIYTQMEESQLKAEPKQTPVPEKPETPVKQKRQLRKDKVND